MNSCEHSKMIFFIIIPIEIIFANLCYIIKNQLTEQTNNICIKYPICINVENFTSLCKKSKLKEN